MPGQVKDRVPRDLARNLLWRKHVFASVASDATGRKRAALMEESRNDFLFWVNTFVWQFNPNAIANSASSASVRSGPFVTWPRQDEMARVASDAMRNGDDLWVGKSREVGASWFFLLLFLHRFLFGRDETYIVVSRNADLVDKADKPGSMFWKLDYVLDRLPEWMTGEYTRKVMSLASRKRGTYINGEATTEKMAVGDRADAMLLDEFSQVGNAWEVYNRTSDVTSCRIFNGTHKGTSTCFNYLAEKAGTVPNLKKFVIHWTHHPDKARGMYHWDAAAQRTVYHDPKHEYDPDWKPVCDGSPSGGYAPGVRSPWYDAQCHRKESARAIAADLDINATGSVEQLFDALMIHHLKAKYGREPLRCDLEYDRETARPLRIHPHASGTLSIWHRLDAEGKPPPARYCMGIDTAQGTGATASCTSIFDAETGQKAAQFESPHIEPKEFAYLNVALGRLYANRDGRPARMCWESGGPGTTMGKHVVLLGYRDIYFRTTEHRLKREISDTPGWPNSPDSMMNLMIAYRDALRSGRCLNPSTSALSETLHFVFGEDGYVSHTGFKDPKDNSAARVNHGDMTIADALAWKMVEELKLLVAKTGQWVASDATSDPPRTDTGLAWRRKLATMQGNSFKA